MAYTKHFKNSDSAMISATYLETGDRVRLVKFAPFDAAALKKAAADFEIARVENPVEGMTGRITAIRDFHGDASYMVIHWDKAPLGVMYYPFIREGRGDIIELA